MTTIMGIIIIIIIIIIIMVIIMVILITAFSVFFFVLVNAPFLHEFTVGVLGFFFTTDAVFLLFTTTANFIRGVVVTIHDGMRVIFFLFVTVTVSLTMFASVG